jgi:hypothetical protein
VGVLLALLPVRCGPCHVSFRTIGGVLPRVHASSRSRRRSPDATSNRRDVHGCHVGTARRRSHLSAGARGRTRGWGPAVDYLLPPPRGEKVTCPSWIAAHGHGWGQWRLARRAPSRQDSGRDSSVTGTRLQLLLSFVLPGCSPGRRLLVRTITVFDMAAHRDAVYDKEKRHV